MDFPTLRSRIYLRSTKGENYIHDPGNYDKDPREDTIVVVREDLFLKVGTIPDPRSTDNYDVKNVLTSSSTFWRVGRQISGTKLPLGEC